MTNRLTPKEKLIAIAQAAIIFAPCWLLVAFGLAM